MSDFAPNRRADHDPCSSLPLPVLLDCLCAMNSPFSPSSCPFTINHLIPQLSSPHTLTIFEICSLCFSLNLTASSTAISSNGFIACLTLVSTPLPSAATRILTA